MQIFSWQKACCGIIRAGSSIILLQEHNRQHVSDGPAGRRNIWHDLAFEHPSAGVMLANSGLGNRSLLFCHVHFFFRTESFGVWPYCNTAPIKNSL